MGLSLKNLAKKAWDQVNPLDNGRTWQNSQGNNKPGVAAPSAWQQIKGEVKHAPGQIKRGATGVGLGAVRSGTGIAQGVSGLVDLASPGHGTNRASKLLDSFAKLTDQTAKNEGVDPFLYRAAQAGTDIASFAIGAGEVNMAARAITKAPQVSRFLEPAMSVVPRINAGIDAATDGAPIIQRAMGAGVKGVVSPKNAMINAAYTAKMTGEDASKGREITPKRIATDLALNTGAEFGLPAAGVIAKAGAKQAAKGAKTAFDKMAEAAKNYEGPDKVFADGPKKSAPTTKPTPGTITRPDGSPVKKPTAATTAKMNQAVDEVKNGLKTKVKEKLVDEDAHIIKNLRNIEKKTGQEGLVDAFYYHSGVQRRSNSIGVHHFENSQHIADAFGGLNKKDMQRFSDYANARRELSYEKGMQTSASRKDLKAVKDAGHAEFSGRYQSLNNHYKELADMLHEEGKIDDKTHAYYKKNNDYIRLQREMDDLVNTSSGSGSSYNGTGNSALQKTTGSGRKAKNVAEVTLERTQQLHNEIARNKTAGHLVDTLERHGQARNLINADDVKFRREQYKFLSDTREGKKQVEKILSRQSKKLRQLQGEVDRLNKRGLDLRLKNTGKKADEPLLTYKRDKINNLKKDVRPAQTKEVVKSGRLEKVVLKPRRVTHSGTMTSELRSRSMTNRETRSLVQNLISGDPKKIKQVRKMITHREPALKALLDDVENLRNTSQAFKQARGEAYRAALERADQSTRHLNTISRWKDGVKEVYEVSHDIKQATERINPFELNAWGKIAAAPGRVFRAGTTGLSAPFTATNYIRDEVGSGIMSKDALATHDPKNIAAGLGNALKDGFGVNVKDPLWQDFIKHAGDQTSYDLTRNARSAKRVVRKVQGGAGNKTINVISNPIRSLEDLNSITEKATRFQNFKGIYEKSMKEGKGHDQSLQDATLAAWQNSVDFNRIGQWSRVINIMIPYWNPGVQGVRQLGRSVRDNPAGTVGKTAGAVMTPVIAATVWNLSDPDRAAVYNNLSDYEKENNLIIIPPGSKTDQQNPDKTHDVWKIPLPPGVGNFAGLGRRAIESHVAKKPQDIAGMTQDVLGAASGPLDLHSPSRFINSITPAGAKPGVNQLRNKDSYTGKQIVPDFIQNDTDPNGNPIAERDKKYKFSSGTAGIIGNKTNKSPIRIEKAIKDTTGATGLNVLNAADNVLAKAGVISKDNIGGTSVKEGFSRRFAKAQGEVDFHATDAQKHFADVEKAIKQVGLNKNEQAAYNIIHPQKKNTLGQELNDKTPVDPMARAAMYIKYNKTWEVDKKADELARKRGAPGNPMFDLNQGQRKTLLAIQVAGPGSNDGNVLKKDNKAWLDDYYNKSSQYYDKVIKKDPKAAKAAGINPIWQSPIASDDVSRKLAAMNQITDGKAKSAYIKENVDVANYLAASNQAERAKRAWIGWEQYKGYPTPDAGLQKTLDAFDKLPKHDGKRGGNKSRYDYIQAHPEMADFFNRVSEYSALQDAKINQYEGHNDGNGSGSGGGSSKSSGSGSSSKGYTDSNGKFHYYKSYGRGGRSGGGSTITGMENSEKFTINAPPSTGKIKANTIRVGKPSISSRGKGSGSKKPKLTRKKQKA